MTTLLPVILVCPYCKQQMFDYQLASVYIYSSIVYSDSKTETEPFIGNDNAIKNCSFCRQAFWLEDAVFHTNNPYKLVDSLPKAVDIADFLFKMENNFQLDLIEYYEKLLKQGFANNTVRKYYLRMRLWWAINDLVRYSASFYKLLRGVVFENRILDFVKNRIKQRKLFNSFNGLLRENVEQLIRLVNPEDEDADFLLAEMHREIGQFKKARHYINKVEEKNHGVVKKMKKAIFFRKKRVFQF